MNRLLWARLLKRCWKLSLALSLGLTASAASAEEIQWRAAKSAPPTPATESAVTMLAPVPLAEARPAALAAVSFQTARDGDAAVIFRAQMSDGPRMMPVGLPEGPADPPAKRTFEGLPLPKSVPSPAGSVTAYPPGPSYVASNQDGCGSFCVNDCCGAPSNRWWVTAEGLVWWVKGQPLPPLVTTGSPADAIPGAIGQPHTAVLFGASTVGDDARGGGRLRAGWWCDDDHLFGIDLGFFGLGQDNTTFGAGSPGSPALFRPFTNAGFVFNSTTGTFVPTAPFEDAEKVAFPGQLAGNVNVRLTSELWGYEANVRTNLLHGCCNCWSWNVDGYAGYRGLGLDESLGVSETLVSTIPGMPGVIAVQDSFQTKNRFNGGQIGLDSELRFGRWFLDVNGRFAVGNVRQTVDIFGQTAVTDALGGIIVSPGGLLAQPTNMGHFSRDRCAILPEGTFSVGYQVTGWFRVFAGYNLLYISSVVRPEGVVNRVVNPTQIPLNGTAFTGSAQPALTFHGTDFFAQGLNVGLEFRW
jgi:hypothetical protein